MENKTQNECAVCKELVKRIEMAVFSWEVVELETVLYRHKIQAQCEVAA